MKKGFSYGATDEFGYQAVENPTSVYELHATILHLLGARLRAAELLLQRRRAAADVRARPGDQGSAGLMIETAAAERSRASAWLTPALQLCDALRL